MAYTLKLRGKTHTVDTLEQAHDLFEAKQDRMGKIIRSAEVYRDGVRVAHISQNGNVWPPEPWFPDMKPFVGTLFDGTEYHSNL